MCMSVCVLVFVLCSSANDCCCCSGHLSTLCCVGRKTSWLADRPTGRQVGSRVGRLTGGQVSSYEFANKQHILALALILARHKFGVWGLGFGGVATLGSFVRLFWTCVEGARIHALLNIFSTPYVLTLLCALMSIYASTYLHHFVLISICFNLYVCQCACRHVHPHIAHTQTLRASQSAVRMLERAFVHCTVFCAL